MSFTFGIEIETHMPRGSVYPGPHGCGAQVSWLPQGWLADEDPSIVLPSNLRVKCEFVSPILSGADGVRQLCEVVAEIKRRGGQVNASCGVHVHVAFDKSNTHAVEKLIRLVANHEKALYAVTGTLTRENGQGSRSGTNWCKSVKQYGTASRARACASRDRYHILNLATTKPTVEFRVFGSSLNATKIVAWVRLCMGLCEKSLASSKSTSWNHKGSEGGLNGSKGVGTKEVARLLFGLGWTYDSVGTRKFGRVKFGAIGADALDSDVAECLRLAQKYDEQTPQ
jgi:hypothetical protein